MQEQVSTSNTRTYQLCPRGWPHWDKPHWFHSPLYDQTDPLRQACLGRTAWPNTDAWIREWNHSPHRFQCSSWPASLSWHVCCEGLVSHRQLQQTRHLRIPVLEPDLHGTLGHVDIRGNPFTGGSGRGWVLVEFHFEGGQLILGCALTFVVLLLLGQGTLAMRPSGGRVGGWSGGGTGSRWRWRRGNRGRRRGRRGCRSHRRVVGVYRRHGVCNIVDRKENKIERRD